MELNNTDQPENPTSAGCHKRLPAVEQRENLVAAAATCIQHMQKALTEMNNQLADVISDISGTTGLADGPITVWKSSYLSSFFDMRCRNLPSPRFKKFLRSRKGNRGARRESAFLRARLNRTSLPNSSRALSSVSKAFARCPANAHTSARFR